MNQRKIGEFLKQLRKEKGLTQEQLAEHFYVSSRSVSRWETGSNMPDIDMLIELADFYNVDIREIIDGERKSESMDNETKDTLKKVAEYATEESNKRKESINQMWFDNVEISKKDSARYGMGWNCDKINGETIICHGGQVENYITYQFILPEKQIAATFMINANDEFGMNMLMANTVPDIISIINGEEPSKVNILLYPMIHILVDIIYLLIVCFSVLIFCKSFRIQKYTFKKVIDYESMFVYPNGRKGK